MRILHIVEPSFAGVGRHVLDLAEEQTGRRHDVHVAFSPIRESKTFREERFHLDDVTFHPVAMTRSPEPGDLRALYLLHRLVRQLQPDVLHTHSTKAGVLGRFLLRRAEVRLHTPNAPYSMNPMMSPRSRAVVGRLERVLGNLRTDAVVAVSPEELEHLVSVGVDRSKLRLVPNGIRPPTFVDPETVRCELGVRSAGPVIGFVGRFNDQKDPLRLIEAFDQMTGHDDACLVMVGDGPLLPRAQERVSRCSSGHRIHLVGERPGARCMAAFDLFVLPSRYEGFPYVLLEAAAHGLPIVTTTDAGASQLVESGCSGWLIPSTDTDQLTAALATALDDPNRVAMGAAAREKGRPFTVEAMVDDVMGAIEDLRH